MLFSPVLSTIAAAFALFLWLILRAGKAHKAQEMMGTAGALKTIRHQFRVIRDRRAMPGAVQPIRATSDRLRLTAVIGCHAVIASIVFAIIKGPTL